MNLNSEDRDNVIRTVLGEVDPRDPDQGRAAVAHVILNRLASGRYGTSATSVVHQRGQFEPWQTRARQLNAIPEDSPEYKHVASIVDGVIGGVVPDPTDGATHFLDRNVTDKRPGGIKRLAPWADKHPMLAQIGGHSFYAPEGRVSATDNDLLDLYTNPKSPPVRSPSTSAQNSPDQDLLDLYTKPSSTPVTRPPPAPRMLGNRVLEDWEVTPGSKNPNPPPPQPSVIQGMKDSIDPTKVLPAAAGAFGQSTAEAFSGATDLTSSGIESLRAGKLAPAFPSGDPRTWEGGGVLKTAAGVVGMGLSPITGAIKSGIQDPLTSLTGNPEFGEKAGLLSGMIVPGGAAVKTTQGIGRKLSTSTRALDNLVDKIGPENVPAVVDRLKSNSRLNIMDVSDPVRVAAQGLIDPAQPEAHQILATSSKERAASAPKANNAAYSSTLGPVPDVEKLVGDLKKKAQDVGQQVINPAVANAKPADITPVVKFIDSQIGPRVLKAIREGKDPGVPLTQTQKDFLELRDRLRGELPDRDSMFMDPAQVHEIQSKLRYEGSTLMKGGGSDALTGGRYMDVRQRLVEALDKTSGEIPVPDGHTRYYRVPDAVSGAHDSAWFTTDAAKGRKIGDGTYLDVADNDLATQGKFFGGSGGKDWRVTKDPQVAQSVQPLMGNYKASLAKYRDAMNVQEAFEDGLNTLQNRPGIKGLEDRPEYLSKWAAEATPEELEGRRLGTRVAVDQKINSVRGAARKATDIPEIEFNREKLATLFGEQETDRLFQIMHDARDEATTNSKLIQGSKTAETLAGQKSLAPREVEPFSLKHNPVGVAGLLATAGTLHGGIVEGGALGGGLLAANIAGSMGKHAVQTVGRKMDLARNVEFSKLATATGGANNPVVDKLLSHPKVRPLLPPPPATGGLPTPTSPTPPPTTPGTSSASWSGVSRRAAMLGGATVLGAAAMGGGKKAAVAISKEAPVATKLAEKAGGTVVKDIPKFIKSALARYEKSGVFEDRMEYGISDLMSSEGIDEKTATALQRALHEEDTDTIWPTKSGHFEPFGKPEPGDKQPLMRDVLERGRSGRPTVTLPMDLTKLQKAIFDRGDAIASENPASIGVGRLLARDVSHGQAAEKLIMPEDEERFNRFISRPDITSGFITNAGFHITREEAMRIARKTRKGLPRRKRLSAEDLDPDALDEPVPQGSYGGPTPEAMRRMRGKDK